MAITEMSIWVQPVNHFTVRRDVLRQCARTPAMDAGMDGEDHEQDYY